MDCLQERKGRREGEMTGWSNQKHAGAEYKSCMDRVLKTLICNYRSHSPKLKQTEQLPVNLNSGEKNDSETKTGLEAKIL